MKTWFEAVSFLYYELPFHISHQFLIGSLVFFLSICKCSLHIKDIDLSSVMCTECTFDPFLIQILTLFTVSVKDFGINE